MTDTIQYFDSLTLSEVGNLCHAKLISRGTKLLPSIIEIVPGAVKRATSEDQIPVIFLLMCKGYAHLYRHEFGEAKAEGYKIRELVPIAMENGFKLDEDPLASMVMWSDDLINTVDGL